MHRTVTNGLWLHTKGGPQFTRFEKELVNENTTGTTIQTHAAGLRQPLRDCLSH